MDEKLSASAHPNYYADFSRVTMGIHFLRWQQHKVQGAFYFTSFCGRISGFKVVGFSDNFLQLNFLLKDRTIKLSWCRIWNQNLECSFWRNLLVLSLSTFVEMCYWLLSICLYVRHNSRKICAPLHISWGDRAELWKYLPIFSSSFIFAFNYWKGFIVKIVSQNIS